jgi:hypothetical protein
MLVEERSINAGQTHEMDPMRGEALALAPNWSHELDAHSTWVGNYLVASHCALTPSKLGKG